MRNGTYYLNNSGSRWVNYTNGVKETIKLTTESGKTIERTVILWESFGNFAIAKIAYKGQFRFVFPDTTLPD